jgi:sulfite reductase (NADPH) hemoprotein beta-component
MYRYDEFDHQFVRERVAQFRDQVARRLNGELAEEEFRPLRLTNGLYLQLHAYMLRVAVPYGSLSARQLRKLAHIARRYDKGYGHFTTRQNIQFNWPRLDEVPDILEELAEVEMHALQTSGNCIRNVTSDQYSGAAADEIEDARVSAEIIRQWSSLHPEFSFLPRKFKIAISGSPHDRAAVKVHDIGLQTLRNDDGEIGYEVFVGGGLGRMPHIGRSIRKFLPKHHLLSYLEAILRVYNLQGRRDNLHRARIKILVDSLGVERFTELVETEWAFTRETAVDIPAEEHARIAAYFAPPAFETLVPVSAALDLQKFEDRAFAQWVRTNVVAHKVPGYAIANISVKPIGGIPGDATAEQMDRVAELAEAYSFGEVRITHEQNLTLPHVRQDDLYALWQNLKKVGLATANVGLLSDIIACPGLDYCNLANARAIPIAQSISRRFDSLERLHDIGGVTLNISGCINACGHHHVGNIGILGVDKKGTEFYQVTLGGSADENAEIGSIIGPSFSAEEVPDAIESIIETYLARRVNGESFVETYRRIGQTPFKEQLYGSH